MFHFIIEILYVMQDQVLHRPRDYPLPYENKTITSYFPAFKQREESKPETTGLSTMKVI